MHLLAPVEAAKAEGEGGHGNGDPDGQLGLDRKGLANEIDLGGRAPVASSFGQADKVHHPGDATIDVGVRGAVEESVESEVHFGRDRPVIGDSGRP